MSANGTFFPYNFEQRLTAMAAEPTARESISTTPMSTMQKCPQTKYNITFGTDINIHLQMLREKHGFMFLSTRVLNMKTPLEKCPVGLDQNNAYWCKKM
jgi:hypothetical protein